MILHEVRNDITVKKLNICVYLNILNTLGSHHYSIVVNVLIALTARRCNVDRVRAPTEKQTGHHFRLARHVCHNTGACFADLPHLSFIAFWGVR